MLERLKHVLVSKLTCKKGQPACLFLIMCLQRLARGLWATFHFQSTSSCLPCLDGSLRSKTWSSLSCKRRAMNLFSPSRFFISFELKRHYIVSEIKLLPLLQNSFQFFNIYTILLLSSCPQGFPSRQGLTTCDDQVSVRAQEVTMNCLWSNQLQVWALIKTSPAHRD